MQTHPGEWLPLDLDAASEGSSALVRRFPIGPITAITPFNFPLNLVGHKVAPALACGNTMLLKPAPQAPLSALNLARIVQEAGAPPGQLNAFFCANELAQTLVTDERIKMLSFTGSAAMGWMLKQKSGKKRVALELGGNAAVVIHSDADLDRAAERCAYGGFTHAGQSCISVQRAFVHQPVFDAFAGKFLQRVRQLKVGDPLNEETDLGPMISQREAERAESWIAEAVAGGAKVLVGGQRDGAVLQPTVLTNMRPDMKVCREEVFAPLVVLEWYQDFGDAIARALVRPSARKTLMSPLGFIFMMRLPAMSEKKTLPSASTAGPSRKQTVPAIPATVFCAYQALGERDGFFLVRRGARRAISA